MTNKFRVVRRHHGDRFYEVGDIREGKKADLAHLVPSVLEPIEEKAEGPAPEDKAEGSAPENKGRSTGKKA
jgi:hypothetical protein